MDGMLERPWADTCRTPIGADAMVFLAGDGEMGQTRALLDQLRRHHASSADHSVRVARVALAMWQRAVDSYGDRNLFLIGAALHDIGKLSVPAATLGSDRRLDPAERHLIRQHPETGAHLLRVLGFAPLIVAMAQDHHERWDGSGYPLARHASALHPATRAVAVADAFVAMVEPGRHYRPPLDCQVALTEIAACRGSQFDPAAADTLLAAFGGHAGPWSDNLN